MANQIEPVEPARVETGDVVLESLEDNPATMQVSVKKLSMDGNGTVVRLLGNVTQPDGTVINDATWEFNDRSRLYRKVRG